MSTTTNGNGGQPPDSAPPDQPMLNVIGQYLKDFSFENPLAPHLSPPSQAPAINIQFNVAPRQLSNTEYEVELKIEGKAEVDGKVLFACEVTYCGMFRLQGIPQEHLAPVLMIECPRMLFPFAREILATATMQGGFPPLLLDPIDFASMYQQRMMSQGEPQPATEA